MATGKRNRRSKAEVINEKLAKAKADKARYQEKIAKIDGTIKKLEASLNSQRQDEVMAAIAQSGISIDDAIKAISSAKQ